jgi:hypothetical protein
MVSRQIPQEALPMCYAQNVFDLTMRQRRQLEGGSILLGKVYEVKKLRPNQRSLLSLVMASTVGFQENLRTIRIGCPSW